MTEEQVHVALEYIAAHRRTVEAEYEGILQRVQQRNSPPINAGRETSPDALKYRIRARCAQGGMHADSRRELRAAARSTIATAQFLTVLMRRTLA